MPSDNSTLYANFRDFDTISNEMGARISSFHPLRPVLHPTPSLDTDSGGGKRDQEQVSSNLIIQELKVRDSCPYAPVSEYMSLKF